MDLPTMLSLAALAPSAFMPMGPAPIASKMYLTKVAMDGKGFAKMAKDTKLIDKKLTGTDVDMTFAKVKERTVRRITFDQFMAGLAVFAEKKQCGADAVHAKVAGS